MTGRQHVTTIRMSEWAKHEAEWRAQGWDFASVAVFKSGGHRMARVVLVKEAGCVTCARLIGEVDRQP